MMAPIVPIPILNSVLMVASTLGPAVDTVILKAMVPVSLPVTAVPLATTGPWTMLQRLGPVAAARVSTLGGFLGS